MADLTTLLSKFLDSLYFTEGRATGVLTTNTTSVNSPADTNENDLWSYTLPANTLSANGKGVRVYAWGTTAANTNTKTMRPYFAGSNMTGIATTTSGASWFLEMVVLRTGASSQIAAVRNLVNANAVVVAGGPTGNGDTTTALIIKVTGQSGTGTAADIVFKGAIVEVLG